MKTRTDQPKNNKYYMRKRSGGYSSAIAGKPTISGADVLCNCVGYAGSRFNEVIGKNKEVYVLACNAEDFIEAAKRQGLKISGTPVQGGIMVWQKGKVGVDSDGAGHVAFVEEVYEDGSILTSESGWASWAFKTVRRDNSNGRWGQSSAYKFRGCIVNPAVKGEVVPTPKLTVDGIGGPATVRAMQSFFGTPEDGIISGQNKALKKYYPALTAVAYGQNGSTCVKKLQKWLGISADGIWGENTSKALQKKLGVTADGFFGTNSMKALQKFLNDQLTKEEPKEEEKPVAKTDYLVIDVSYVQKTVDWAKVKAAGIKGAIIRCGYRGYGSGKLCQDDMFMTHIKGAHAAGLKVGVYFFTEGINASEGKEEATYTLNLVKKAGIPLSYPIAIDTEHINASGVRANNLSKAKRTEVIKAFCEEIKKQGYEPMIYASLNWFENNLDMSKLPYKVWCAQYYSKCQYKGEYIMWQYTSEGKVNGISGVVDMNHCYIEAKEYTVKDPAPAETPAGPVKKTEYPELGKEAKIKVADAVVLACDELAFPYSTPEKDTKYLHAKLDKVTKYDADRPTAANKAAFDKIFPNHWNWGSQKYGYGQRTNACCDDFAALVVRYSGADKSCPHAVDTVANGKWKTDNFEPQKYKSKSQLVPGAVLSYFKIGGGGHMMIIYAGSRRCDAGINDRYGKIRYMGSRFYDFDKHIKAGTVYIPKDKYISIKRSFLAKGMVSDEVAKLQRCLGITDDGIFGPNTKKAVVAFQKKYGLTQDGLFGPKSLAKMKEVM